VERILAEPSFKRRAQELSDELARYQPLEIIDEYFAGVPELRQSV
jgi:hypothetical protein